MVQTRKLTYGVMTASAITLTPTIAAAGSCWIGCWYGAGCWAGSWA